MRQENSSYRLTLGVAAGATDATAELAVATESVVAAGALVLASVDWISQTDISCTRGSPSGPVTGVNVSVHVSSMGPSELKNPCQKMLCCYMASEHTSVRCSASAR